MRTRSSWPPISPVMSILLDLSEPRHQDMFGVVPAELAKGGDGFPDEDERVRQF